MYELKLKLINLPTYLIVANINKLQYGEATQSLNININKI